MHRTNVDHNIDGADVMIDEAMNDTAPSDNPDRVLAAAQVRALTALAQNVGRVADELERRGLDS